MCKIIIIIYLWEKPKKSEVDRQGVVTHFFEICGPNYMMMRTSLKHHANTSISIYLLAILVHENFVSLSKLKIQQGRCAWTDAIEPGFNRKDSGSLMTVICCILAILVLMVPRFLYFCRVVASWWRARQQVIIKKLFS